MPPDAPAPAEAVARGVVAILIAPNGLVITADCFDRAVPGGFDLLEMQRHSAQQRLAQAVWTELTSPLLEGALRHSRLAELLRDLIRQGGWKLTLKEIGHDR